MCFGKGIFKWHCEWPCPRHILPLEQTKALWFYWSSCLRQLKCLPATVFLMTRRSTNVIMCTYLCILYMIYYVNSSKRTVRGYIYIRYRYICIHWSTLHLLRWQERGTWNFKLSSRTIEMAWSRNTGTHSPDVAWFSCIMLSADLRRYFMANEWNTSKPCPTEIVGTAAWTPQFRGLVRILRLQGRRQHKVLFFGGITIRIQPMPRKQHLEFQDILLSRIVMHCEFLLTLSICTWLMFGAMRSWSALAFVSSNEAGYQQH